MTSSCFLTYNIGLGFVFFECIGCSCLRLLYNYDIIMPFCSFLVYMILFFNQSFKQFTKYNIIIYLRSDTNILIQNLCNETLFIVLFLWNTSLGLQNAFSYTVSICKEEDVHIILWISTK